MKIQDYLTAPNAWEMYPGSALQVSDPSNVRILPPILPDASPIEILEIANGLRDEEDLYPRFAYRMDVSQANPVEISFG